MAAVVILTFAFLLYQVNCQIVGLGPPFGIQRGCESTAPCTDIRSPISVCDSCGVKTSPNLIFTPIQNTKPCNQPCANKPMAQILNLAAPSCVKNQSPIYGTVLPTQQIISNIAPKCPNVQSCQVCSNTPKCANIQVSPICSNAPKCSNIQVSQITPSVVTNNAPEVVTVIDNTLANSLANALQLLIMSNLMESSGSCNSGNLPCINNYEIVTPDFTLPSISCDIYSNPCSEQVSCPEPAYSFPETTYSCSEPVVSCPEPVVIQTSPNFGGSYSYVDSSAGFPCGLNNVFVQEPQCMAQVSPSYVSSEPLAPIPVVASVPPMAIEVPFPATIPAQLTCNLGFLPTNEPCVTFNVEALPCGSVMGNYGNFI